MGWMHDTLKYIEEDPINRVYHHDEVTKPMMYAWSENYILPYSHDEVVHGKGSMIAKMPGDRWQALANLRALYGFMWTQPGKKLIFMGSEFAQSDEWRSTQSLDWHLTEYHEHRQIQGLIGDLNQSYRALPELYQRDTRPDGFEWWVVDDRASNIIAYARIGDNGERLVSITNFSPVPHDHYRLPQLGGSEWKLALNTDDLRYGGSGYSVNIDSEVSEISIPPLATIWLREVNQR
jgi:1,4-alpha-glucan branching enzyme